MRKMIKHRTKGRGLPPGTPVYVGEKKMDQARITVVDYDAQHIEEKTVDSAEACRPFKDSNTVTWINIDGLHDVDLIQSIGKIFGLHPLMVEDILNTEQRPKLEDFNETLYMVFKMFRRDETDDGIIIEQVSIVLGKNFVLSFQERIGDVFDPLRERLRKGIGRVRSMGADYLAYCLADAIVDGYFAGLEKLSDTVEDLEDKVVARPTPQTIQQIHSLKRDLLFVRKSVWPLREVVSGLQRGESPLITNAIGVYLRDVYDHTIQVIDTVETLRDMLSGMLDIYLSSVSNRMNEVMKVLTIIATIFIPLTFIAGIYGMNFKYMPELEWRLGYPAVLIVMLAVAGAMLYYFRRKKWL